MENSDGTVDYVYCHSDGYVAGVGKGLVSKTRSETRRLIAMGDQTCLGISYKEWRDEDCPAKRLASRQAYLGELGGSWCEFGYLLTKTGTWLMARPGDASFRSLKREISNLPDDEPMAHKRSYR
jgi:hypothetical protein